MQGKFDHTVLIVDDEPTIGKILGNMMKEIGARYVYVKSGREALETIQSALRPFSLILSDQQMPGMKGSVFLEAAKEISPETIRFLITGYTDMEAVTEALNKGAIHRYISKPWDNRILIEIIRAGLEQYELILENHRLFALAKEQNAQLYRLNIEFQKNAKLHQKIILEKDEQIAELTARFAKRFENRNHIHEIEALLKERQISDQENLNALYAAMTVKLYEQFQDIATRNGFEMQ